MTWEVVVNALPLWCVWVGVVRAAAFKLQHLEFRPLRFQVLHPFTPGNRMHNTVEYWTVIPYPVYLPAMFALLLFVDGPAMPISEINAIMTVIIKEYHIHRGLAHSWLG